MAQPRLTMTLGNAQKEAVATLARSLRVLCLKKPVLRSHTSEEANYLPLHRLPGQNWQAAATKQWGYRWYYTRTTRTCPPHTQTCVFFTLRNRHPKFKTWCDDYFYLKHRGEPRGIGGLFFDDFNGEGFDHAFGLMQSVATHFFKAYEPIATRRRNTPFTDDQKNFQCYRRGRYVEFNLVFDRGTLFGLQSGGRTESILMSLPPRVHWEYRYEPKPGTPEAALTTDFLPAKDWLA